MSVFGKFPRTFWVANVIELFERWAWYGFFMLFANYLTGSSDAGGLEFTQEQKGWLMGVGTGILYFLPVLTGAIADRYGYRKVLFLAFLIYVSVSFSVFFTVSFSFATVPDGFVDSGFSFLPHALIESAAAVIKIISPVFLMIFSFHKTNRDRECDF